MRDDRRGAEALGVCCGLRGRLVAAGGMLSAARAPDGGFALVATLPGAVS